jgi:hypothetical protein
VSYYVKDEAPCIDCGTPTNKRQPKSRAPLCFECGVTRACGQIIASAKAGERRIARDARAGRKAKAG